ncbi:MAG: hypothetical protein RJA44_1271 [Pseudomonadota bacterium]|jgi:hypothetical protein
MDSSFLDAWHTRLIVAGAVAVVLLFWFGRRRSHTAANANTNSGRTLDAVDTVVGWPPEATRLMTIRHRRAFDMLRRAVPECMVLAQVPMSRFLKVPTRLSYVEWLRRVGHVCVNLVVCDAASNVIAVIEISESERTDSERTRKRRQRVERVLRAAGIPLHVWNEAWLPDPLAVRRLLLPGEAVNENNGGLPQQQTTAVVYPSTATYADEPDTRPQGDPPRASWFDELHATRPTPLDNGAVVTREEDYPMPIRRGPLGQQQR